MHIADLTMFYAPESGGIKTYLTAKSRWLRRHEGYRHSLIIPAHPDFSGHNAEPARARGAQVRLRSLPAAAGYRLPYALGEARRAIETLQPDIVEVGDATHLAWQATRACRRLSIPVVAFCHSDLPQAAGRVLGPTAQAAAARYLRSLYSRFDLLLAPSRHMAARLRELGFSNVQVQPLGVDTDVFQPARADPGVRARLQLASDARLLVYVGRFAPEKNLDVVAAAMQKLGPRCVMAAVGSGPVRVEAPNVKVLPYISDPEALAAVIAASDLFVHAGDQETFGLAVLEALACGVPVVGAAAGGIAELIDDQVGALTRPGDAGALADAIVSTLQRDRHSLRTAARRRALERHDWNSVLPQLIGHYRALLRASVRASPESRAAA